MVKELKEETPCWINFGDSVNTMQVNCFDENTEMSIVIRNKGKKVGDEVRLNPKKGYSNSQRKTLYCYWRTIYKYFTNN